MPATAPMANVNVDVSLRISQLLNPRFGMFPSPRDVAKYFCKVLATIGAEKLPVKIYMDHELTEKISSLLEMLGVRFRTIPVSRMEPPYILFFIDEETGRLVIETADPNLKKNRYVVRLDLFLDELSVLAVRIRDKKLDKERRKKLEEKEKELVAIPVPGVEELTRMKPEELLKLIKDIIEEEP